MGLIGFLLSPLSCQMSVDLLPTGAFVRRPLLWIDLIGRNKATISYSPTFGYELCARRVQGQPLDAYDLSHWRSAGLGGDMIRMPPLKAFVEAFAPAGFSDQGLRGQLRHGRGHPGPVDGPAGQGPARRDPGRRAPGARRPGRRCAGRLGAGPRLRPLRPALPNHFLEVRGEDGAVLPERGVGRIFAKGPSVMSGYFANPDETARVLSTDGWLDTGDIGFFIEGEIVITGRAKDLIILNGRNIWPQDLEWTADHEIDGLRSGDVCAFSIPAEPEDQIVVLVQARGGDADTRAADGRAGRHPAAHPPRRRRQGQAGRRPRPAPDLVGQAEPLEGQDRLSGRNLRRLGGGGRRRHRSHGLPGPPSGPRPG
jgi:fatty-acyl-CoA synthase